MSAREHRGPRGLVGALQAAAVRRWPAHLRDEQCREWTAELEALRDEPRSGLRRLGFVLSLAVGPVPWARPITVTVAVRLLYLLAALQVVGLAVQLGQAGTIVDATAAAYRGTGDEESVSVVVTTTVGAVLAGLFTIAYIVLAILTGRGRDTARIITSVIGGIGVTCGVFSVIDSAFRSTLSLIGETPEGANGAEIQRQVNDALPSWYHPFVIALGAIGLLVVLAVIVLLALPPSHEFFRKPPGLHLSGEAADPGRSRQPSGRGWGRSSSTS